MATVTTVINQINTQTLTFLPAVLAGVQAAETANASGEDKFHAVLDTVSGISGAASQISSNPTVAGIAGLTNLAVAILNLLGAFKHKAK